MQRVPDGAQRSCPSLLLTNPAFEPLCGQINFDLMTNMFIKANATNSAQVRDEHQEGRRSAGTKQDNRTTEAVSKVAGRSDGAVDHDPERRGREHLAAASAGGDLDHQADRLPHEKTAGRRDGQVDHRGVPATAGKQTDDQRTQEEGPASMVLRQGDVTSENSHGWDSSGIGGASMYFLSIPASTRSA